jgi:hypothetical protein
MKYPLDNTQEVFIVKSEYQELNNKKKKEVLQSILDWIGVETSNLK